jgi:hypothetical protein
MFEHHSQPILGPIKFVGRVVCSVALVSSLGAASLAFGVLGYHYTEHMAWLDALLNAAMILGGMGPVDVLHTNGGKFFASFYALYSGLFLIAATGILLAPVLHRVIHFLHHAPKGKKNL